MRTDREREEKVSLPVPEEGARQKRMREQDTGSSIEKRRRDIVVEGRR